MRVLFWVPYPTEGASNRYRVEQYLPYFKKEGIEFSLHPFWTSAAYKILYKKGYFLRKAYFLALGTLFRFLDIIRISRYDVVFIHREAYPIGGAFLESILKASGKPIIFDFDDAIFLSNTSNNNSFIERFKRPQRFSYIVSISRHVIAGNSYLYKYASQYNPNVSVIPTPINTDACFLEAKINSVNTVVGWMGSGTTLFFLNLMRNVFTVLSGQTDNLIFKIVGGRFEVDGLSCIFSKPWLLEEQLPDLKSFDIGIMPMPDNEWTRGKCGFKAILYMSMGIPCICSPVGMNKEIIKDGVNGFLADTEKEWIEKLGLLIGNSKLRERLGLAGRKTVEEAYSVKVNLPKLIKVIRNVYNGN